MRVRKPGRGGRKGPLEMVAALHAQQKSRHEDPALEFGRDVSLSVRVYRHIGICPRGEIGSGSKRVGMIREGSGKKGIKKNNIIALFVLV